MLYFDIFDLERFARLAEMTLKCHSRSSKIYLFKIKSYMQYNKREKERREIDSG